MKLQPKFTNTTREEMAKANGKQRAVCTHVERFRELAGDHDAWLIGNSTSGEVALLCDDCAVLVDDVTDWRAPYRLVGDINAHINELAKAIANGEQVVGDTAIGRKAVRLARRRAVR